MYNFVTIVGKASPQKVHWKNTFTYTRNYDSCVIGVAWDSIQKSALQAQNYPPYICKSKMHEEETAIDDFKNVGDLNRHVRQHRRGNWFYCDFCDYKNKDKRNTDSHQRGTCGGR